MKIELLYFDGCPHAEGAKALVEDTLAELKITATIQLTRVADHDDAIAKQFLGSPSVRINGDDLEGVEGQSAGWSMRCRIYHTESGVSGLPPRDLLRARLLDANRN